MQFKSFHWLSAIMVYIDKSLHLAWTNAQIFVRGYHLSRVANSSRKTASFEEQIILMSKDK